MSERKKETKKGKKERKKEVWPASERMIQIDSRFKTSRDSELTLSRSSFRQVSRSIFVGYVRSEWNGQRYFSKQEKRPEVDQDPFSIIKTPGTIDEVNLTE